MPERRHTYKQTMSAYTDDELVRGARNLDQNVLVEIYDRYSSGIFAFAYRLLGNSEMAEDCVAETFTRFLNALQNQKGPSENIRAYLYRIAHNWINDIYRSQASIKEESIEDRLEIKDAIHVEESVDYKWQIATIREHIMNLTPDQRMVITLRYIEGWDLEDIARALQKPVGAVKALQHRGLSVLQKTLGRQEDSNEI